MNAHVFNAYKISQSFLRAANECRQIAELRHEREIQCAKAMFNYSRLVWLCQFFRQVPVSRVEIAVDVALPLLASLLFLSLFLCFAVLCAL